jgi:hypothetical protein
MTISHRTQTLIDRVPKNHQLSSSMTAAMVAALAAAEQFAGHKIALASDSRRTPLGQRQALQESLVQNHGKQWARAKAPIAKARKEIEKRRGALVVKAVDPQNITAALERQEIRTWLRTLDLGARQGVVLGTTDVRILEAMVTAPPELSGVVAAELAGKVEERYLELSFPDEIAAIAAADAVVSEAEAAVGIAYNELRSTVDMHPHDFDALMRPLETIRPLLTSDKMQIIEIDAAGKASYRPASQSERDNGVVYGSDEHKAAQGMDVAA